MARVTIDDVADLAGVSIKTVSRVVNREPNVREATRERVDAAIAQLNYRPNTSARNLASQNSRVVVLLYDNPDDYELPSSGYIVRLQQGVLAACRVTDHQLLIHPCNYRKSGITHELESLIEQFRPVGVVIAAPLSNRPEIVDVIEAAGKPFVCLSPGEHIHGHASVVTNDREVSAEMTGYLASLGHRRIAFICGNPSHRAVGNRFLGYKDGLEQQGIEFDETLVMDGDNSIGSGEACADQLLTMTAPPTAIFAANDDMAAGVIRIAHRMNIDVPQQLSVCGFDDSSLARQIFPALTTIRQPLSTMAKHAADYLIRFARDKDATVEADIVPATIQSRDSTGPAPDISATSE
ncbi:MAG: LacI family DNA-binding transcriptional regulator [Pseudomonadota bacterium]